MADKSITVFKNDKLFANVTLCENAKSRRTGLLKTKELGSENGVFAGILMVIPGYRRKYSGFINSIHMIGMKFPIFVAWIDENGVVTDTCAAEPGFHIYSPEHRPTYILELNIEAKNSLRAEDTVVFKDESGNIYSCSKNQK